MIKNKRIANMHRHKADNAKMFMLIMAYLQVIGRSIAESKTFSTDDIRLELDSSKIRYGKVDRKWLRAHLGNMTKSFIAQKKILRTDRFTTSRYNSGALPLYVGIDNGAGGPNLK